MEYHQLERRKMQIRGRKKNITKEGLEENERGHLHADSPTIAHSWFGVGVGVGGVLVC